MRRRILIPIDDEPAPTEDTIRASLLNWLSKPVVVSATTGADADLIRVYAARNLSGNGRATMVHPFKTCRVPYETAKNQLRNIFSQALKEHTKVSWSAIDDELKWRKKDGLEQLVLNTTAPGNPVLATIEIIEPELKWIEVTQAIKDALN
tara:strand:+ start:362 stop:811 length:450 start_codon:yes stop_codon:yes gene_type:complete